MGLFVVLLSSCANHQVSSKAESVKAETTLSEKVLDEELQRVATKALGKHEGSVIVIDPQTGRLRAVVNPRLAFEQPFPPGSAIKPFTALAAMRTGLLDRENRRLCNTRYVRPDFEIVCSHPKSKSPFDLAEALAYSCNDYFAHVGEKLNEGTFNSTLSSFGFGSRTGVSANESQGSLPRGEWHMRDALGESDHLLVTPIQLIIAYTALVNGGHLYRPHQAHQAQQEFSRLDISARHRDQLIEGMHGAVKYGTAEKARPADLPGYVIGKTGTSTSSNGFRTQGWFVGFAAKKGALGTPRADQIRLGVLVFLKRANGKQCAEVAREIFESGSKWHRLQSLQSPVSEAAQTSVCATLSNPQSVRIHLVTEKITRELPIEDYLVGVLAGETSIEDELEALKAQAIISRTFTWKNRGRHAREGYDFCSTTHCQRIILAEDQSQERSKARGAVEATSGMVLHDSAGEVVDAYFHAACGGETASIEALWGVKPAPLYLLGVRDQYCISMPHRRWTQTIPVSRLAAALQSDERSDAGSRLNSIIINKRDATGRAEWITLEGLRRRVVRGWDFKMIVGRSLGWQMIKSSRFDVTRAGENFVFSGSGFGHGLGLCQEGAHVMARRGMNHRQIINHYFPGTNLDLRQQPLSSEHFRATVSDGEDRNSVESAMRILERARADLLLRLEKASVPLAEKSPFEIVIHPTTSDFIASTGQSGWAAGVTRGRKIELQPLRVLQKRGILESTLRHELTHAVVEVLSDGQAPRWLAEGLAIHVAGEGAKVMRAGPGIKLTRDELERRFARPAPVKTMRELYAAAYREVLSLIQSEGEAKVWQQLVNQL